MLKKIEKELDKELPKEGEPFMMIPRGEKIEVYNSERGSYKYVITQEDDYASLDIVNGDNVFREVEHKFPLWDAMKKIIEAYNLSHCPLSSHLEKELLSKKG